MTTKITIIFPVSCKSQPPPAQNTAHICTVNHLQIKHKQDISAWLRNTLGLLQLWKDEE